MTKKESCSCGASTDKLDRTLGGIRDMARVPSATGGDARRSRSAPTEAASWGIPVVAILDTELRPGRGQTS